MAWSLGRPPVDAVFAEDAREDSTDEHNHNRRNDDHDNDRQVHDIR